MADININTGLVIKADINQLLSESLGALVKFRENRKFNEASYNELLEKYAATVTQLQTISNQINDMVNEAQANQLPNSNDMQVIDQFAGLLGAKNDDGSIDLGKLMQLKDTFRDKNDD